MKDKTCTWHDWKNSMDKTYAIAKEECGIFMMSCDDYEQMKKAIELEIKKVQDSLVTLHCTRNKKEVYPEIFSFIDERGIIHMKIDMDDGGGLQ